MRKAAIIFVMMGMAAGVAHAQDTELAAPVKACIRDNAPKVEKTVSSLTDATDFLVDDVCAAEMSAESERQTQLNLAKITEQQNCIAAAGTDAKARLACGPQNAFAEIFARMPLVTVPLSKRLPEATAYAARELLRLRLSKSGN